MSITTEDPIGIYKRRTDAYYVCIYADGAEVHVMQPPELTGCSIVHSIIKPLADVAKVSATPLIGPRQRTSGE